MPVLSDENRYQILKLLSDNPDLNQRQIAAALGLSLGKVNYCLKGLIEKGMIKVKNFSRSSNKKQYIYLLTLKGVEEKGRVTLHYLARKQKEYDQLVGELEELKAEASQLQQRDD